MNILPRETGPSEKWPVWFRVDSTRLIDSGVAMLVKFLDLHEGFQATLLLVLDALNVQGDFHLVTHYQTACLKNAVVRQAKVQPVDF